MYSKLLGELPVVISHTEYENNFKTVHKMDSQGILSMFVFLKHQLMTKIVAILEEKLVLPLLQLPLFYTHLFSKGSKMMFCRELLLPTKRENKSICPDF